MPAEVFAGFASSLQRDYRGTLLRFLSLQVGGNNSTRAILKTLRAQIFEHGEPQPAALAAGLSILQLSDLRTELVDIPAPALIVHGSHDRLTPPAAGEYLATQLPHARLWRVPGAAHAPFLSHASAFAQLFAQVGSASLLDIPMNCLVDEPASLALAGHPIQQGYGALG